MAKKATPPEKTLKLAKPGKVKTAAPDIPSFEHDGKKYLVTKGAVIRFQAGIQEMSAADIAVSPEAQKYLVENACSCIEEVTE